MSTTEVTEKLNQVLKAVDKLYKRMDNFYSKLDDFNLCLVHLDKFNAKFEEIETSLNSKADTEAVLATKTNSTDFEKIHDRLKKLEAQERERQTQAVMRESYEKRMNILIHGLSENFTSAWETRETTKSVIYQFMRDGLKIEDPEKITVAGYHRLPQKPIFNARKRRCRPVIIKFTNAADKARLQSKKTAWRVENGHYALDIDNQRAPLPVD